jgi:hypothetical protein
MSKLPTRLSSEISARFQSSGNTLSRDIKDNPRDLITLEIGDSKQPDFKPQAKISRWDNEVNFSLRAQEHPDAVVETEGKLIKYKTPDYEVHQYDLDPSELGEDGGLEFEWVLPKKPENNVLTATIQTKGLNFYYQPALTQKEIDEGASRPENVVGSYAVYHAIKGGMNRADGMEYKTGKAFHIYRPKVTDANGVETWAELNIDEASGLLSVTVDQKWLERAVYPVVVDPTLGLTSNGASAFALSDNVYRGLKITAPEDGTINSTSVWFLEFSGQTSNFKGVLTDAGADVIETNGVTDAADVVGTGADVLYTANYSTGPSIVASTDYIMWVIFLETFAASISYDSTAEQGWQANPNSYATPTAPVGEGATTNDYSIYATYTASGGTEEAEVSPVSTTFTVPSVTATFESEQTASVSPIATTFTAVAIAALATFSAGVAPISTTYTVPATTATYDAVLSASVAPQSVTFTPPALTAAYVQVETASVAPIATTFSVPSTTATYSEPAPRSLDLEASNSEYAYISDGDQTDLNPTGDFTLEGQFQFESTPSSDTMMPLITKYAVSSSNRTFQWGLYNDAGTLKIQAQVYNSAGSQDVVRWNWTPATDGTWFHLALTFDISQATASEFELFIVGVSQGNGTVIVDNNISDIKDSTVDFAIGMAREGTDFFDGKIDDVRVWSDVRTSGEIDDNRDTELNGDEAGLVGYWKFNTSLADETSNGNDLSFSPASPTYSTEIPFSFDETASVSPVVANFTVPSTTASYIQIATASVAPISSTFSVPSTSATYEAVLDADVAPVATTYIVPAVNATYIQVETAGVAPISSTFTVPATTATFEGIFNAQVSPVAITFAVPALTASVIANAAVSPVGITFTVPSVTAIGTSFTAVTSSSVITFVVPELAAGFSIDALVSPVLINFGVSIPTPDVIKTWALMQKIDDSDNWTPQTKIDDSQNWTSSSKIDNSDN